MRSKAFLTQFTPLLCVALLSSCTITPTRITLEDGSPAYTMDCTSGIEQCIQAAQLSCPNGYDVIEQGTHTQTVVPHYGEFPLTITTEILTVRCH
jgi:hypothetical protein